ncbi:MAG: HEPN domain-containing protein [Kiritimatiellae bacterium]|nr:HEPN domain-containing protein [Kiritimatiellia bacterium]
MSADPALQAQLQSMLNKARRSLKAARRHCDDSDFDFAASRAYYAAFYSMEAALLAEGVTCSTHSGAIAAFSERFIKTGILPVESGGKITRLFRERQIGDYEFDVSVTAVDAEQDVQAAAAIVEAVDRHLRRAALL